MKDFKEFRPTEELLQDEDERQAWEFLQRHNIKYFYRFVKYDYYFSGDDHKRDIYEVRLWRENIKYGWTFTFGQSVADSGRYYRIDSWGNVVDCSDEFPGFLDPDRRQWRERTERIVPTPYDVLACLTKYPPGTFEQFCAEYGYDSDSRCAFDTWVNVVEEWFRVNQFFTDEELEELREIE